MLFYLWWQGRVRPLRFGRLGFKAFRLVIWSYGHARNRCLRPSAQHSQKKGIVRKCLAGARSGQKEWVRIVLHTEYITLSLQSAWKLSRTHGSCRRHAPNEIRGTSAANGRNKVAVVQGRSGSACQSTHA